MRPRCICWFARETSVQNMSRYLVDRIERLENVQVACCTEVKELIGRRRG